MSEVATAAGFARLLSDERLTRRAVAGDERAFAAIFRRYHQSLYRFCLAIVGNPEDAQDALQNTMIKVMRALPGEERQIELKPWLYRIAHNESIDLLRRRRETRELDAEEVAPGRGLTEDVAMRERLRRLFADLGELPERQREVLVMRELAGLDFEEIGAALETSGAVARQTLYEARQSLLQMEEGREMACGAVMRALSDGDGRVLRRRDVRAHLRSCPECRGFRDEIEGRERDLAALSPLPAAAAVGMLQGLLGGSGAATGGGLAAALGGGAAKTIGTSAVAKGVATAAVVATVGVTAADRAGVVHVLPGEGGGAKSSTPVPGAAGEDSGQTGDGSGESQGGGAQGGAAGAGGQGDGESRVADRVATNGSQKAPSASPAAEAQHPGVAKGHGKGRQDHPQQGSKAHGPPEHAVARGHEKQPPGKAKGQEAAAGKSPQSSPPKSAAPSVPESTPGAAPKGPPASSPSAAPPKATGPPPHSSAGGAGKGKGAEKSSAAKST